MSKFIRGCNPATLPLAGTELLVVDDTTDDHKCLALDEVAKRAGAYVDVQQFTASGTWTKPAWARPNSRVEVLMIGGGGGGGPGMRGAAGTVRAGGSCGGAGCVVRGAFAASDFGATEAVTISGGTGTGGTGSTADDTSGGSASPGASVAFGALLAVGGKNGFPGATGAAAFAAAAGSNWLSGVTIAAIAGSPGNVNIQPATPTVGNTPGFPTNGAGGGSVRADNVALAGGNAAALGNGTNGAANPFILGALGGAAIGSNGQDGPTPPLMFKAGMAGAGGGSNASGAGGRGGDASGYGAGGGGGGAGLNGFTGARGGNGSPALCLIVTRL